MRKITTILLTLTMTLGVVFTGNMGNVKNITADEGMPGLLLRESGRLPVLFTVDNKPLCEVSWDDEKGRLKESEMPKDPVKEGYIFRGWYFINSAGEELQLNEYNLPYNIDKSGKISPIVVHAKFVSQDAYNRIIKFNFIRDIFYVPIESDGEEGYLTKKIDLKPYLDVYPFYGNLNTISISIEGTYNEADAKIDDDKLCVTKPGVYTIIAKHESVIAKTKVVVVEADTVEESTKFTVYPKVIVEKGKVSKVNLLFENEYNLSIHSFDNFKFYSGNEAIVTVNRNGIVYGTKAGRTTITTICLKDGEMTLKSTEVIVVDNAAKEVKPAKAKIKKVYKKKTKSDKVKISLKKLKNVSGYQVAIYKKNKDAKKNKNALVKKFVKKATFTIKAKKLKGIKKVYVRARAYKKDGKKKIYGQWSKVK